MWKDKLRGWGLILALLGIAAAVTAVAVYILRGAAMDAARMATYLPQRPDAMLLYADVAAARNSGVLARIAGTRVVEEPEYRAFIEGSGFDYKRDLDRVLMSSGNGIHYFVLQGRFNWDQLQSYAGAHGGACEDGYCYLPGSTPDRVISFRRLSQNVMALASARDRNGALAVEQRSTAGDRDFTIPSAPMWAYMPAEMIRAAERYPAGTRLFAKALESAETVIFTLAPSAAELELAVDVTCSTAQDAAVLKAQLEGVTELLQKLIAREGKSPSAADLSGVLTSGSFQREERHVRGRWPLPAAFLESLGAN